jgi:organic radical activating enzyme
MIVEWECILNCNYKCFYCGNGRNDMLRCPIQHEPDKRKVFSFLDGLLVRYPGCELFVFGGEPFTHPFIYDIILHMHNIGLKYVIQTNLSHIDKIRCILRVVDFPIQASIHPKEIGEIRATVDSITSIQEHLRRVDVMFVGEESLKVYRAIHRCLDDTRKLYLAPIADFNTGESCSRHLFDFNIQKKSVLGKIYRFEEGNRSIKWEQQMKGELSYKGQPCLYKDRYVLFDPALNQYNCSYRQNNEACPNDSCFLM